MTMVERVARAICREEHLLVYAFGLWRPGELDRKIEQYWRRHLPTARAAIEAMREPTEAMTLAGDERGDPTSMYQAMIDAALSEAAKC